MKKIKVIYWSGTGNTEMMAKAVADGASSGGSVVELLDVSKASADTVAQADAVALGCSAMGAEVLEEGEMEPFIESIKGVVSGKPIVLFGSYGWGDGEWMRDWETRCKEAGAVLICESVICNEMPDDEGIQSCKALGENLGQ